MKKKLVAGLVGISILATMLIGCGGKEEVPPEETGEVVEQSDEVFELKLGHIMPAEHPNGLASEEFARLVEEETDGRVKVSVFHASSLGTAQEVVDSIAIGAVDFTIDGFGEPAKQYLPFQLLDAPYLAKDREHFMRILNSEAVATMYEEMRQKTGISVLGSVYYGARYITTSDFEVNSPSDLEGKIIRVPDQSMYVSTLGAMGAVATPMAFSEVFMALSNGVVDGQENPLATIYSNKFFEVQKYLVKTQHIMGGNIFLASDKTLEKLPEDLRQIVVECAAKASEFGTEKAYELEDQYLQELVDEGMILIENPDNDAFKESVKSIFENPDAAWTKEQYEAIKAVE